MEIFSNSSGTSQIQSAFSFTLLVNFSRSCGWLRAGQNNHQSLSSTGDVPSNLPAVYNLWDMGEMRQVKSLAFPFFFWVPEGAEAAMDLPGHSKLLLINSTVKRLQPQNQVLRRRGPKRARICPVTPDKTGYLSLPCQEPLNATSRINPSRCGGGTEIPGGPPAPCTFT